MAALDGKITIATSEYRPCMVGENRALFHRWEDKAEIVAPSALRGGHNGGEVRATVAIVENEDGSISEVYPYKVKFLDSEDLFSERWPQCADGVTGDGETG